ncbi:MULTISPECIES: S9 family peptidase [unclassified Sphingomonas]|uniref:alpha/beta hydrolase family protein n=1 Tax=Sphingomonas TaxID=13687 RepID=UPI00095CDE25|nr:MULTISPECIES: S9 family peptidase [unclassified Sphingomonas]MBN8810659.1 S9 family peptidase [Sphingomonas sp.]OJY49424.1 MAG: peptidase S9 [Sphingomonas sp. 67-41]
MKHILLAGVALASTAAPALARDLTIQDVATLSRVGAPAVSPDGHWLVWQQRETDLAANRGRYDLWRLDLTVKGAKPEKLVAEADVNETSPQFSADGKTVWFQSDKGGEDAVWGIAITGGTATRLTHIPGGFNGFKVSPDGSKLLVWADRKPGAPSLEPAMVKKDPNAGSGRTYDQLFVRHWDTWSNGERSQLFVLPFGPDGATGNGVAIEGGLIGDSPSKPFGGGEEVAWSADGKTVYFALREAGRIEAKSTNLDIFAAPADGSSAPVNLTKANEGMDNLPTVSPDGKWLAYFSMARATYEADRQVLQLRNLATGETRALTQAWDRSVGSIAWAPDSRTIYVTAEDTQENPIWSVDPQTGKVARLTQLGNVTAVVPTKGGIVYSMNSLTAPDDFYQLKGKASTRLTSVNAEKLAGIDLPKVERFSFAGANNDTVWGYSVRPAGLAAGGKAPIAFIVHGGPQGSSNNSWSYRWNPAVFAGAGYAVVAVDFHGSTGYGQAFTDAIRNNWGGWPLEDLQKGLKAATDKFSYLDADNACALGASYGGYMMNWIEGQWPDRFKCIVQHDGVFDARAMAYETEELWFDEWEHGGKAYFEDPAAFEKWNPVNHVDKWKTPQLVITSEKDFRIPYTQGLAAFTALQRRDIPSKLLVFPDENHWVLKPKNSMQWYGTVLGWLDRYTGKQQDAGTAAAR